MTLTLLLLGVVLSCIIIWKVSDLFEDATDYLGRNMSNGVKGASLNAIASSMPELILSFIFLFKLHGAEGYAGTIGTTAGSAVFNTLLIPATIILAVYAWKILGKGENIPLSSRVMKRDGAFLIASEIALIVLISSDGITWMDGGILLLIYAIYAWKLFKDSKLDEDGDGVADNYIEGTKKESITAWVKLSISVILMTLICWLLVYCVEHIGKELNINLLFTSIVLAAAASSVPDLVISLKDAKKGNYDDAVSNALGSNIFDICVAHGLPLFLYTLMFGSIMMTEEITLASMGLRIALLIVTGISIIFYLRKTGVNRTTGFYFIGLYILFIAYSMHQAFS